MRIGYLSRRLCTGENQTSLLDAAVSAILGRGWLHLASKAPRNDSSPAPGRPGSANNLGEHRGSMGLSS